MRQGPRIHFKTDLQSSIGRGAVMRPGHFRPELSIIIWAAGVTADPMWTDIMVTEGDRPRIRAGRDLHPELRALDLGLNHISGDVSDRRKAGEAWAERIGDLLGPGYDLIVHGEGSNLHLHIELDP